MTDAVQQILDQIASDRAANARIIAEVIDDKQHVRVPMMLTDHRPHFATDDQGDEREAAYREMVARNEAAWRDPPVEVDDHHHHDTRKPLDVFKENINRAPTRDAAEVEAIREQAWQGYCDRLTAAWRVKG